MKNILLYVVVASMVAFFACEKEVKKEEEVKKPTAITDTTIIDTTVIIDASSKVPLTYKYFSFEKNDTVKLTNNTDSINGWDLKLKRTNIYSNSGLSGKGLAGVYKTDKVDEAGFNEITVVPNDAVFVTDDSLTIAFQGGYMKSVGNAFLNEWYSMISANPSDPKSVTQIVSNNYIYIVKTAKGKYAKVWFKSYYNVDGTSGFITMRYVYQPDGSKNLKK